MVFSLGDCDRFSGMNATPGKPGALICLGNYATVIPTPIEGEGGGDKTKLSNSFFFFLGNPGIVIQPLKWNCKVTFPNKPWALVRKHLRLAPPEAAQFLERCHPKHMCCFSLTCA